MDLSIVIPVFNEGQKIARDIAEAARFLTASRLSGEILVVDDGSTDATAAAAEALPLPAGVERRVIRLPRNEGKGAAVRAGVIASQGDFVMFADSGGCVPYEMATRGLDLVRQGVCDVACGSRWQGESIIHQHQAFHRRVLSRLFRWIARRVLTLPAGLTDTQCGFKVYRGDVARELFEACRTPGFLFDLEILMLASRRGYRIREFPVEWRCDLDSRLAPGRTTKQTLRELWALRQRWNRP